MPRFLPEVLILTVFLDLFAGGRVQAQMAWSESWPRQLGNDTAAVNGLIRKSRGYQNAPDSAIVLLRESLALSQSIGYAEGCARSLLGIGTQYFNKGELEKSKACFRQAFPWCWKAHYAKPDILLSWYNNMASPYAVQGRSDTAAHFYYQALDYLRTSGKPDTGMMSLILGNLGTVWQKAAQYKQALFYTRRSLELARLRRDTARIADAYQNIGLILEGMNDHTRSLQWLRAAYAMHRSRNDLLKAQMDCCAIGLHYSNVQQADSALKYFDEGLALSALTDVPPLHKLYIAQGYAYLQKGDPGPAAAALRHALDRSVELGYTGDLPFIYSGLADIYTANGDYKRANEYRRAYILAQDSLVNAEKILTANTLEVKYRTAEKDKEIAEARLLLALRDSELRQKNFWIAFAACGAAVLLIGLVALMGRHRRKRKLEKQHLLNLQQEQEISHLKSMMAGEEKERVRIARELHDGIMVQLASIKMKLRKVASRSQDNHEEFSGVLEQLDTTTRELRQTAHNLMPDMLLEDGLADALFYCCSNLQKGTDLHIDFQHYGNLPPLSQEVHLYIYRIIQELLQNIIKHAHAGKALVQMNYRAPLLSFTVEDDGIGYDRHSVEPGMGLKNVYSRLRALKGSMDVKSGRQGTTVYLELDIQPFLQNTDDNVHSDSYSR